MSPKSATAAGADPRPSPPHQTFDGWSADRARLPMHAPDRTASFEPSAVASTVDPRTHRETFVVLNDFFDPTQYHFELDAKDQLVATERVARATMTLEGHPGVFAPKFEAVSALPDGRFLATTPFNRPEVETHRIFTFGYAEGRHAVAREVAFDRPAFEGFIRARSGQPWFQVEGLAVDAAARHAFFGVRFTGESREGAKQPTVTLVRCPFDGAALGTPTSAVTLSTVKALGRQEGLADLQRDPRDGSYLLLTSFEGADVTALGNNQGHLFRLPAELVEHATSDTPLELPAPLASFEGKPEGVTALKDGRLLVIFDDDREWKDNFKGYARRQAMFAVLDAQGQPVPPRP
ncbi:MAG: hypothetical protein K1X89_29350 [Myxococcaceae bacterium]|nr:hypothetical protein [Myxococcaceae bacterium]